MTQKFTVWIPSVRIWLEQILSERFGHYFLLEEQGKEVCLKLMGHQGVIAITSSVRMFSRSDSNLPYAEWQASKEGWREVLEKPLPAPGVSNLPSPLIESSKEGFHIHYDILGLTYWMLSRQEEVGRTDLDEHRRFPASSSHASKYGYLERPVVDEWLNVLGQVIERQWPNIVLTKHQFTVKVSHDVDTPSMYGFKSWKTIIRMMAGHVLKRGDFKEFFNAPRVRLNSAACLHPADPFNTFEWLMQTSENLGLISAFYFICGRTNKVRDADYELEHPAIRKLMRRIYERGHEIGLHPSYHTYRLPDLIKSELNKLIYVCKEEGIRQAEWGGRMHYLRWEQPTTLQAWDDAGLAYDTTMTYADHAGFRCGTSFEYPAINPATKEKLNLRIRPLIVMESTIMDSGYMGLGTGELAYKKIISLQKKCHQVGGIFTLLWHNSQLALDCERKLYLRVLEGSKYLASHHIGHLR